MPSTTPAAISPSDVGRPASATSKSSRSRAHQCRDRPQIDAEQAHRSQKVFHRCRDRAKARFGHDDWKTTNPLAVLKLSVAVFGWRAVHEVVENAIGLGRRQSTASNADREPNCATKGRTRRARKKSRVLRSRHPAHGHLDDNHGASADQVSAGHVDVDGPIGHRRDDVLAGTGCAGVCARKRLAGPDCADRAAVKRSSPDAVHDDLIALGPQLGDRLVHRRRAGRSGVRSSGQSERGGCQCCGGECGEEEAFHIRNFRVFW
jgi:hypothetical protein